MEIDHEWIQTCADRLSALGYNVAAEQLRSVTTRHELRVVMGIETEWPDIVLEDILDAEYIED